MPRGVQESRRRTPAGVEAPEAFQHARCLREARHVMPPARAPPHSLAEAGFLSAAARARRRQASLSCLSAHISVTFARHERSPPFEDIFVDEYMSRGIGATRRVVPRRYHIFLMAITRGLLLISTAFSFYVASSRLGFAVTQDDFAWVTSSAPLHAQELRDASIIGQRTPSSSRKR